MIEIDCGMCIWCFQPAILEVDDPILAIKITSWRINPRDYIQNALPELTAFQREMLISGTHEECFKAAFAYNEDQ